MKVSPTADERLEQLKCLEKTHYSDNSNRAENILALIEGAEPTVERIQLLAHALMYCNIPFTCERKEDESDAVSDELWEKYTSDLKKTVRAWGKRFSPLKDRPLQVAEFLWQRIESFPGRRKKIVALAMVLEEMAPYQEVPIGMSWLDDGEISQAMKTSKQVRRAYGLLHTMRRAEIDPQKIANVMHTHLAETRNAEERMAILYLMCASTVITATVLHITTPVAEE